MNEFSVLLSVYEKEDPVFLQQSLQSLVTQTLLPKKIVVVKDGALPEPLDNILREFKNLYTDLFLIIGYEKNRGLGEALNYGLSFVDTKLVARMDTDDIAIDERFQVQIRFLQENPDVDLVGSWIAEFGNDPHSAERIKKTPEFPDEILKKARFKNPVNHMTVVFKKDKVEAAGGYRHAPFFEDYDLWIRMLCKRMKFYNLPLPLIKARIGNDMLGKRHGWRYMMHELKHFRNMRKLGFISQPEFLLIVWLRLPLRLMPKKILSFFYTFALRKNISP